MQSFLHEFIIHQQPEKLIKHIRENPDYPRGEINHQGLTLLQLAAREGMIEVVLWLLYAGEEIDLVHAEYVSDNSRNMRQAKKTPLYFSMEYQHSIVTQILLVCGADVNKVFSSAIELEQPEVKHMAKECKMTPMIKDAVLFWQTKNFHQNYQLKLLQNMQEDFNKVNLIEEPDTGIGLGLGLSSSGTKMSISFASASTDISWFLRHMAFAAQKNQVAFFEMPILNEVKYDSDTLTPAYWAAVNNNEDLYHRLCAGQEAETKDVLKEGITLYQLKAERQEAFDKFVEKAEKKSQDVILDIEGNDSKPIKSTLAKNVFHAYQAASRANEKEFFRLCKNHLDHGAVFLYAFQQRNFVAIETVLKKNQNPKLLFEYMLENRQYHAAVFLLIATNTDVYNMALELCANKELLLQHFIPHCGMREGILYSVISHGARELLPDHRNKSLFSALNVSDQQAANVLIYCIKDRYKELTTQIDVQSLPYSIQGEMSDELQSLISTFFSRFGLPAVKREKETPLQIVANIFPDSIWNLTLEYLDDEDYKELKNWNQLFHDRVQRVMLGPNWNRSHQLFLLEQQSAALKNFIKLGEKALEKANCCRNRWDGSSAFCLFFMLATAITVGILSYESNKMSGELEDIEYEMKGIIVPFSHNNCFDEYAKDSGNLAFCNVTTGAYDICVNLCNRWASSSHILFDVFVACMLLAFGGLYGLVPFASMLKDVFSLGRERFSTSDFSELHPSLEELEKIDPGKFSAVFMRQSLIDSLGIVRSMRNVVETEIESFKSLSHSPALFRSSSSPVSDNDLREPLLPKADSKERDRGRSLSF